MFVLFLVYDIESIYPAQTFVHNQVPCSVAPISVFYQISLHSEHLPLS